MLENDSTPMRRLNFLYASTDGFSFAYLFAQVMESRLKLCLLLHEQ
jgi:hypothetical protein